MDAIADARTVMTVLLAAGILVSISLYVTKRWILPIRRRRRSERRTTYNIARGLPTAVVLLQLAIRSGAHPRNALAAVVDLPFDSGAVTEVATLFRAVHERLELGADMTSAMLALQRPAPDVNRVLDALRRAEVDGGPVATHLEVLVSDLRSQRRTVLDGAAQRLTISMLFPLVLCILPAFVLLAVVPLVLAALRGLPG